MERDLPATGKTGKKLREPVTDTQLPLLLELQDGCRGELLGNRPDPERRPRPGGHPFLYPGKTVAATEELLSIAADNYRETGRTLCNVIGEVQVGKFRGQGSRGKDLRIRFLRAPFKEQLLNTLPAANPRHIERPQALDEQGVHIDTLIKQRFHRIDIALDDCRCQPPAIPLSCRHWLGAYDPGKSKKGWKQPGIHFEAASPGLAMQ